MFGMEKNQNAFVFDLEKNLKKDPKHKKELLTKAEHCEKEIKHSLREGPSEKEADHLGIVLKGYAALQRVLKRM